jgi:hypothetical protein
VPILAFWRPKQIVNDAWRASDPDDPPIVADSTWHHRRVPLLLTAWWALFLLGNILDNVSARIPSETVEHNRASIRWGLAGSIVALPAALLAVRVVSEITNRQRLRAAALEALPTG